MSLPAPTTVFLTGSPTVEHHRITDAILALRPGVLFVCAGDGTRRRRPRSWRPLPDWATPRGRLPRGPRRREFRPEPPSPYLEVADPTTGTSPLTVEPVPIRAGGVDAQAVPVRAAERPNTIDGASA